MRSSFCVVFAFAISTALTVSTESSAQSRLIQSTVYATFERSGPNTELIGLAVGDISPGTKVIINCSGASCPFSTKTINVSDAVKMLAITDMFIDTTFKPGTTVEVRVTRSGTIGRVFAYETRPDADPKVTKQCLAADNSNRVAC